MAKTSRFTFRSLHRDARDLGEQAVWSAVPGTDDVPYLQALRDALAAADLAALVTPSLEEEAAVFMRTAYPQVRTARFEFDPFTAHIDEDLRVVYVDVAGRVFGTSRDGDEFTTEEYDYYAAQAAMSLLEEYVSRSVGDVAVAPA